MESSGCIGGPRQRAPARSPGRLAVERAEVGTGADVATLLALRGDLDISTSLLLRECLVDLAAEGARRVVVDLAQVGFVDSSGLGALLGGLKRLQSAGGDLHLAGCGPRMVQKLERTGLDGLFQTFASVLDATPGA